LWIRFCYDATTPQMNFKPGDAVEVPDDVVRRWQLIWELFVLQGWEMGNWKSRGMRTETKALPPRDERTGYIEVPLELPPARLVDLTHREVS